MHKVNIMNRKTKNKNGLIVFGIMLALPALLSLFIAVQLYATVLRFS
jgi:hypothetical protein